MGLLRVARYGPCTGFQRLQTREVSSRAWSASDRKDPYSTVLECNSPPIGEEFTGQCEDGFELVTKSHELVTS